MHLKFSLSDLPSLKTDLRRYHPNVIASQRIEAAARGFGFKSYTVMRMALEKAECELSPDDAVFFDYIGQPNSDPSENRSLSRALARIAVRRMMDIEPSLTTRGFDTAYPRFQEERKLTLIQRKAALAERRKETLHDGVMDEFELALIYLDKQERRKTVNQDFGSYHLKHDAEDISREKGLHTHLGNYVSNGIFIIAAMSRGFVVKQTGYDSPNAYLNISSKTIRANAVGHAYTRRDKAALMAMALAS